MQHFMTLDEAEALQGKRAFLGRARDFYMLEGSTSGPLMRALRTLRRVKGLLGEPVKPEKRSIAAGSFSGNLFADNVEHDMLHMLDEEEDGPTMPPSLGEEWAGLIDRTFARVRYALRREGRYSQLEEVRFEPHMGIPGVPVWDYQQSNRNLRDIAAYLGRISESLDRLLTHAEESNKETATAAETFEEAVKAYSAAASGAVVADDPAGTDLTGVDL